MVDNACWIEVSLQTDGEMAEAVADVFGNFAAGSVVIESAVSHEGELEIRADSVRVCAYLRVDADIEDTRRRISEAIWYLGRIHKPLPEPRFKIVEEIDWVEQWKKHYRPIEVGRRMLVLPAWMDSPDADRIALRIEPGMAFGTGTHPTTQLALALLEEVLSGELAAGLGASPDVFDIGCGSGILSVAAAQLGAGRVLGVDIDAQAVASARENAGQNGLQDRIEWGRGSVSELGGGLFTQTQASVVVANILARILIELFDQGLADLVAPGGYLVLSGILETQLDQMTALIVSNSMRIVKIERLEDWVGLVASN